MTMAKKLPLLAPSIHTFEVNGTYTDCEAKRTVFMNITQRMYFGQFPLDKDRDRRIAFYGRVSTQHEAQVDALGNQMQW